MLVKIYKASRLNREQRAYKEKVIIKMRQAVAKNRQHAEAGRFRMRQVVAQMRRDRLV